MQISRYGDIGDILDGVLVRERLCSLSFVASENLKIIRNTKTKLEIYEERKQYDRIQKALHSTFITGRRF